MKCYVDLDGKIPAKTGDRVARADCGDVVFIQEVESMRPVYAEFDGICGITDIRGYGITGNNVDYLRAEINPPK